MIDVAAVFGRQRMQQQPAGRGIARIDEFGDHLEILARLLLGPGAAARRKLLQTEIIVALDVAHVAAGVAVPLLQEDRLDAALEGFEIERGRRRELADEAHPQRDRNDHCQTTRHSCFSPYLGKILADERRARDGVVPSPWGWPWRGRSAARSPANGAGAARLSWAN